MEETTKTNGELTAEEKRKKQLANLKPFRKGEERAKECAILGGIKRGEQIKQRKSLNELANRLLDGHVSRERAVEILGDTANFFSDDELTNGALMLARVFQETMENGTTKNAEFLRDTSGQKPTERIETTVNAMTEADRELLRNIADRFKVENADKPRE